LAFYGHLQPGSRPVVAALRVSGWIAAPAIPTPRLAIASGRSPRPKKHRDVWMEDVGLATGVPVYYGPDLPSGCANGGPRSLEERTTTVLAPPRDALRIDGSATLITKIDAMEQRPANARQHEVAL